MKIKDFIQSEVLLPIIKRSGVLVVYDPDRRYRELCHELGSDKLRIIDATDSSITSRFEAQAALAAFGQPHTTLEGILIYVPAKAPLTEGNKQRDPFALYAAMGAVFPASDGDEYLSICLKSRPDYATEIRRVFAADPNPSFETIDAVGSNAGWPILQAQLKAGSAREILLAILSPSAEQKAALRSNTTWINEASELFKSTLAFHLKTKIKTWDAIAEELWRFLLFSEFKFDLPVDLPTALNNVPFASDEARFLVEDLCASLRSDQRTCPEYIERAEKIQEDMSLSVICQRIDDFGLRDTFPFEELASFARGVDALLRNNLGLLRQVFERHAHSVWVDRAESQAQWTLIQSASRLVQACEDAGQQLSDPPRDLENLIRAYTTRLHEVDHLQREFEQFAADMIDPGNAAQKVIAQTRPLYRQIVQKMQGYLIRQVENTGWPVAGILANNEVFDKLVAPRLMESGHRIALILIDALRYELGAELARQLNDLGQIDVQAACAQLPSITLVGMASLLPGAGQSLAMQKKDDQVEVMLNDQPVSNVTRRMDILRNRYGARFAELDLSRYVKDAPQIDQAVDLVVLRSNEMDNDFETNPEAAPGLISRTFQKVRAAMHRLRDQGFKEAVIVTDHGFYMNMGLEAGDTCVRPSGNWVNVHERMMLGDGVEDPANLVMPAQHLGIRGDFNQAATPRSLVAYRANQVYFHGGISLQEAIVPVITIGFRTQAAGLASRLSIVLRYKRGSTKITTRVPVIEVAAEASDLFARETEFMLEAYDANGQVVGEAKPGGAVNPATRIISLKPGEVLQITLKMDENFEGKFTVKALDPTTQAALGAPLSLETEYVV